MRFTKSYIHLDWLVRCWVTQLAGVWGWGNKGLASASNIVWIVGTSCLLLEHCVVLLCCCNYIAGLIGGLLVLSTSLSHLLPPP